MNEFRACPFCKTRAKRITELEAKLARLKDVFGPGDMWNWGDDHRNEAREKIIDILRTPFDIEDEDEDKYFSCYYCGRHLKTLAERQNNGDVR